METKGQVEVIIPKRHDRRRTSAVEFYLRLRDEEPELFEPFDHAGIIAAALAKGMPLSVHEDVHTHWVSMNRSILDPGYRQKRIDRNIEVEAARRDRDSRVLTDVEIVERKAATATLKTLGPDTVMHDGRRLGEWTAHDVTEHAGGLMRLIEHLAADKYDQPLEAVLKPRDWKRLNK